MDIFDALTLLGGLSLFLFGMSLMGSALEKRAGSGLKVLLGRLTTKKISGFLMGLGVTAVIQSSSATTVMVVGFVNSGIMTLQQAINVIMGANVGTTVTAWLLSLTGLQGESLLVQLLKPSSFTPLLAAAGVVLYMVGHDERKKDVGTVLLGFATLMFGMETMSGAVSGLKDVPAFTQVLLLFRSPVLGVLAGAGLTAVIQSSSASVGILQALSATGQITYGTAIPIIMGQNIGTCVTALLASVGTNKNARRAAVVHLLFNVVGTVVWLSVFCASDAVFHFPFVNETINQLGIAEVHTTFNLLCVAMLLPLSGALEKLACRIIPDRRATDATAELDERLLATPAMAIERSRVLTVAMAQTAIRSLRSAAGLLTAYDAAVARSVREDEAQADHYEDILGTYLVRLSTRAMTDADSREAAKLLHVIGDFERISDHAVNLTESAEELQAKGISFSGQARRELSTLTAAVDEIVSLTLTAFVNSDTETAAQVEPLEQVVDTLKEQLRARHILRMQRGECSIEAGFVWADLLSNLERVADHCSNIAGCVIEMPYASLELHSYLGSVRSGSGDFARRYAEYSRKYALMPDGT